MTIFKQLSIGRQELNNDIICQGEKVSSVHCELQFSSHHWFIKDLMVCDVAVQQKIIVIYVSFVIFQSQNGVYINSIKIPSLTATLLKPGDVVGIGSMFNYGSDDFIFELLKKSNTVCFL